MGRATVVIKSSIIAAVVILFAVSSASSAEVSKQKKDRAKLEKVLEMEEASIASSGSTFKRKTLKYDADNFRDPFANPFTPLQEETIKPVVKEVKLPELTVQGLMWGGKYPQAIINDRVVKVGDTIEGATITGINRLQVLVVFADKQYSLPSPGVLEKDTKKKSKGGRP